MNLLSFFGSRKAPVISTKDTAFERLTIASARQEVRELRNRYEGAQPGTTARSWIPAFTRDARYDANSLSRWEMVRKIRYFERNVWIVGALKKVFQKYTVGPFGVPVVPASSDPAWNAKMFKSYAKWCVSPCVDSRANMGAVQKMIAGEYDTDGEVFVLKTRPAIVAGVRSVPKIKLIESHRCSSPGKPFSTEESDEMVDGVQLNADGLPIGYWIRDGFQGDEWNLKSSKDVIQIFEPSRIGMWRSVTPYAPVLNKTHDLDDLDMLEMGKAKKNAEVAYWISTWNGEVPPNLLRRERGLAGSTVGNANQELSKDLAKRIEEYRSVLGSNVFSLKPGEKADQHVSNSPSAATQWYWRYCVSQICAAKGVPVMLVLPESIQGTVARGILDDANIYFRSQFHVMEPAFKDIYLYYAQWARYNEPELVDAPGDWDKCHVIAPRAVNVDQGRNSAAMLAELAAGVTNWDDIAGEEGTTAEVLIRKKAANAKMIRDVAKEFGIEPAEISAPLASVLQSLALANQAQATADTIEKDDPDPKEKETVNA